MARAGMVPVTVKREVAGFVLNRLQIALVAEAFRLVADGVVSPADLDATVKHGLGLRWSFMGPFETIDLNAPGGVADYCARYGALYDEVQSEMTPCQLTPELVRRRRRGTAERAAARRPAGAAGMARPAADGAAGAQGRPACVGFWGVSAGLSKPAGLRLVVVLTTARSRR